MDKYIDAAVDGLYTAAVALSGYMIGVGAGGPVWPSNAAILAAVVAGVIGFANQLRALRAAP